MNARNLPNRHAHMYTEINTDQLLKCEVLSIRVLNHVSITTEIKKKPQNNDVP